MNPGRQFGGSELPGFGVFEPRAIHSTVEPQLKPRDHGNREITTHDGSITSLLNGNGPPLATL